MEVILRFHYSKVAAVWLRLLGISLLLLPCLSACIYPRPGDGPEISGIFNLHKDWNYADLRGLFPAESSEPDSRLEPESDLIAVYSRLTKTDLQIRLDFFDLDLHPGSDITVYLGVTQLTAAQGQAWDLVLFFPANGSPVVQGFKERKHPSSTWLNPSPVFPRVVRDPWQDTVEISLPRAAMASAERGFRMQVDLSAAGSRETVDSSGPLRSDDPPPSPVRLMLVFWHTLVAYTPAQALRSWDGAHAGPYGGRHGLHVLLLAARRWRFPLFLMDLKTPAALSVLDFLNGVNLVRHLNAAGLLFLSDALPGSPAFPELANSFPDWALERFAAESRALGLEFGLPSSQLLYAPGGLMSGDLPGYRMVFTPLEAEGAFRWQDRTLISLPATKDDPQAGPQGPTPSVKKALLEQALENQIRGGAQRLFVLGGSLPESAWGAPEPAEATLRYLSRHPWIQPISLQDLLVSQPSWREPGRAGFLTQVVNQAFDSDLFSQFPESRLPLIQAGVQPVLTQEQYTLPAWQAYQTLAAPLVNASWWLPALRLAYSGQVGQLLTMTEWAANPSHSLSCDEDLNHDGMKECVLTSEKYWALLDPDGGRLVYLFGLDGGGLHQYIAPSAQFISGLADPNEWDLSHGAGADPAVLAGAFLDGPAPWTRYNVSSLPGEVDRLTFIHPTNSSKKTYRLTPTGLRVNYAGFGQSAGAGNSDWWIPIPIALDPWQRFSPDWGSRFETAGFENGLVDRWSWGLKEGPEIVLQASTQLKVSTFTDSRASLLKPEDPNFAYPLGHFLPFPMALVELATATEIEVNFIISQK